MPETGKMDDEKVSFIERGMAPKYRPDIHGYLFLLGEGTLFFMSILIILSIYVLDSIRNNMFHQIITGPYMVIFTGWCLAGIIKGVDRYSWIGTMPLLCLVPPVVSIGCGLYLADTEYYFGVGITVISFVFMTLIDTFLETCLLEWRIIFGTFCVAGMMLPIINVLLPIVYGLHDNITNLPFIPGLLIILLFIICTAVIIQAPPEIRKYHYLFYYVTCISIMGFIIVPSFIFAPESYN